ncbi:hypothetical protein [Fulvivirga sedimenti]|uniref:Uncharacterized protein n=1 Tax=Fulvivirga sedimenti TaxID=2879465 RepID=A0A9X1KYW5_9BACT|nr:hypothetical protein [Fulvivirga sedimenti]MCA6075602.1 hypothetical protein [Fulvivirga sedimenti]
MGRQCLSYFMLFCLVACTEGISTDGQFYRTIVEIEEPVNIYPARMRHLERIDSSRICVFLEKDFDWDEVALYINSSTIPLFKKVETDESLDLASYFELGNISEIDHLRLQVNGGPLLTLPVDGQHPLWAVRFSPDTLKEIRLAAPPIYE